MVSPVLLTTQEYPTLTAAAYEGLGPSRDQKGGFIYPDFYENFMGFIQLKSHYFKEYTVQGSTNRIFLLHGVQPLGEFYGVHNWLIIPEYDN